MDQSVHWQDGMMFLPHHMQATERYLGRYVALGQQWNQHHNWGLRTIEIDTDALADHHLVVRTLRARFRDGTMISVPEDGTLASLELTPFFENARVVTIALVLPKLRLGTPNVLSLSGDNESIESQTNGPDAREVRYRVGPLEVEDENSGANTQTIHFRWPNFQLLPDSGSLAGYETIPIVRGRQSEAQEGTVEVDETFIPPLLACDCWDVLKEQILESNYDHISTKVKQLASEVVSRQITFDTKHYGASRRLNQLRVLNEAYTTLHTLAFGNGFHPCWVYGELCRLVSQLAIFAPDHSVPDLPVYDHDDLGKCFFRVKIVLDTLLGRIVDTTYQARPFIGEQLRVQVSLDEGWLLPKWKSYVGVQSDLAADECIRLLTRGHLLNMKIGSAKPISQKMTRVDEIYAKGERGLQFTHIPKPPQALPHEPGLIFFEISPESSPQEWDNVKQSRTLAIRLNQKLLADQNMQGKHLLTIRTEKRLIQMRLTLYLVDFEQADITAEVRKP
ncbi:MAG: type VI secretion system baseplate subunit TssK [Gemmataceae bacterium]